MTDEAHRRRIGRQLNKGESLHSLRRDLFFAHDGAVGVVTVTPRTPRRCAYHWWSTPSSAGTPLTSSSALGDLTERRGKIDPGLLGHISPALMEHVNPYGTYEFPVETEYARTGYRPFRDSS